MIRRAKDDEREERINMEIIVDVYGRVASHKNLTQGQSLPHLLI